MAKKKIKEYSLDWFIGFFSKIPKKKWTMNVSHNANGQCCAIGHLAKKTMAKDAYTNPFVKTLNSFFQDRCVWDINDNSKGIYTKLGKHPKDRVVNALKNVKNGLPYYQE